MRTRLALAVAGAVAAVAAPAAAQAAPPLPFGHACVPQNGVLFCPTANDAQRVQSFDGVPLDVDVTLPPTGNGPFPTIVILHGFGASKTSYEAVTAEGQQLNGTIKKTAFHNNNVFYAKRGYAVVNYSARGFGRSCGVRSSRNVPGCAKGWLHLGDQRFEIRDTQHLLGMLVDEGVAKASALGVTGESYGAGQTLELARLRNRVELPNGKGVPWRSPKGTKLAIKAAWARWPWTDLAQSLTPNGRFGLLPAGVKKQSYVDGLFLLANVTGFVAPPGADSSADLAAWKVVLDKGEPYGAAARAVAKELERFHSAVGLPAHSAPVLTQSGWRDELFPVTESLRSYDALRHVKGSRVAMQIGDVGHSAGTNNLDVNRAFNDQAARWFDALLKHTRKALPNGRITAFQTVCPKTSAVAGFYRGQSMRKIAPGVAKLGGTKTQVVTSGGGNLATALAFDQRSNGDACKTVPSERAPGTGVYTRLVRRGYTMLGLPVARADVREIGRDGFISARLWDVFDGQQRLVSRGVYRLTPNQHGRIAIKLFGNGYRFAKGHHEKLELVGRDPNYLRTDNESYKVRVSNLVLHIPTTKLHAR
ncbi:MAG TPA: CocE/NonD family hydrolase [Thermoleophilaceae bacterium]|nr:CocE/NonD family hydrolase [Thermoleophilaceae bacterium]